MALTLPPEDQEKLHAAICRAFAGENGHARLNTLVKRALGFDIYVELGGPATPINDFASGLTDQVTQAGTTATLLEALFLERKGDPALRELALRALPGAETLVPAAVHEKALLESAQGGVGALDRLRGDPAVRDRLGEAAVDLRRISAELDLLAGYKSLHDVLHDVQLRLYPQIAEETARLATDPDSALNLSIHAADLSTSAAKAVDAAEALTDPVLASPELSWTAGFEALATQLEAAAEAPDQAGARLAVMELKQLLRFQPPRLNNMLVQTARQIPVSKLVETMRVAAASLAENDAERPSLADAANALEALVRDIRARVEEHEAWQVVETRFWLTEDALQRDDQLAVDELNALWPMVTRQIEAIQAMAAGDWATDLKRHAGDFAAACPIPATPPVAPEARRAFQRYVHRSRVQFYFVDRALKSRCIDVAKLSSPLRQLLGP
ncbi:MAG: hypothetical protein QOD42_3149 [Sphingomonadales bacterium]|nr:hypothetical protein [Sphingomonadales bacterium]